MRTFQFLRAILTSVLLVLMCAGCSTEPTDMQVEATPAIENNIDTVEEPIQYSATPEIEAAPLYSNALQIGNTAFSKPPQYNDIIDAGAVLATKDKTESYLLSPGEKIRADFKIKDTTISLYMSNDGDMPCSLKDATIEDTFYAKGPDVFFPMGIRAGNTLSELTERWGQPTLDTTGSTDTALTYQFMEYPVDIKRVGSLSSSIKSSTGFSYTVTIDRNSAEITSITAKGFDRSPNGSMVDITKTTTMMNGDTYLLSYKIPYEFLQNTNELGTMTAYVIDNVPYVFVLNNSLGIIAQIGDKKSDITETYLLEEFNDIYSSLVYEVDKVKIEGDTGTIIGYAKTDEGYVCSGIYMKPEAKYILSDSFIIPLDENSEVSETALAKFKEIMTTFMESITESSNTKEKPLPTPAPTPTPEPTTALEEQSGILGTWNYYGYYDPLKWGFKVNQTQLIPDEKIDKTDDSFTITLLENALDDGGEETYSLKYSPDGKTATVDTDMFWQFVLVDENQLLEFNGDATFIYVR